MPAKAHSLWWVMSSNGDMGACWVAADQQCRHGCVLGGCCSAMETWVRAGWVLISNGDMGVCVCAGWVLISDGDMGACRVSVDQQWRHAWVHGGF